MRYFVSLTTRHDKNYLLYQSIMDIYNQLILIASRSNQLLQIIEIKCNFSLVSTQNVLFKKTLF